MYVGSLVLQWYGVILRLVRRVVDGASGGKIIFVVLLSVEDARSCFGETRGCAHRDEEVSKLLASGNADNDNLAFVDCVGDEVET